MQEKVRNTNIKKSKIPLILSLVVVAIIIGGYFLIPSMETFFDEAWRVLSSNDNQKIEAWVSNFGWKGPLVLILGMIIQMFLLVIPSLALMVVSILAYGPIGGSLIILVSIFAASSVGYFIGRYFGPIIVQKILGRKSEKKVSAFLEDYGFWAVIVTRINPFLSNDAISLVGGILRMGYWKFIGATLIGIMPLTIFIAIIGENTYSLKSGLLWASIVSILIFGLYVYWDKKKNRTRRI